MEVLKIQPTPFYVNKVDEIICYLYSCYMRDCPAVLEYNEEASCSHTTGLYRILDNFCNHTKYAKENITVITGNLKESHSLYNIVHNMVYWHDYQKVQNAMHNFVVTNNINKHFASFVGRSSWSRLWLCSELYNNHREKTLQTYHSHLQCNYYTRPDDGVYDEIGLEHLNQLACTDFTGVAQFLTHCPITVDEEKINYPMHYPANLNIANLYQYIFVDIVTECYVDGNVFALTEKTWRPIACKRPFLLMSSRLALANFKKLGFKTFSNWWDESYDDYEGADRVKKLLEQINIIAQWPIEQCIETWHDMQSVLDHNFNQLVHLKDTDFNKDWK